MRICIEEVNQLIDQILQEFDQDKDQHLNKKQLTNYLKMAKKARGDPEKITDQEITEVLQMLGVSKTHKIGRKQLYIAIVSSTVNE